MQLFLSTHSIKLDDKGRISVPASYRLLLESKEEQIFGLMSFRNPCIEIYTKSRLEGINRYIEELDLFSPKRDMLSTAILSSIEPFNIDTKGRVMLPQHFLEFASLKNEVMVVGKGESFEIWSRENFAPSYQKARTTLLSTYTLEEDKK